MIASILEKCLNELNKDEVDFSYIKGMLEVLLAMQPPMGVPFGKTADSKPANVGSNPTTPAPLDEAAILDATARASLETIKRLAEASKE